MLTNSQWMNVHSLSIKIHQSQSREDLVRLVLDKLPKAIGIHYSVWHDRVKGGELKAEAVKANDGYREGIIENLDLINRNLGSHPIITGLDMQDGIDLPYEVVTTMDFASRRQIKETAIYREAYRHIEIENHAVVEFFDKNDEGVMICLNGDDRFSEDQKLMIRLLRDHLSLAYSRLNSEAQNEKKLGEVFEQVVVDSFSKREKETLPYLINGKTNAEIGIILGISHRTVEKHVASLLEKTGLENRKMFITSKLAGL